MMKMTVGVPIVAGLTEKLFEHPGLFPVGGVYLGKGGKGRARTYSANDMRSMAKNPTSSHRKAAADNRANQLNPKHPAYSKSRSVIGVTVGATGSAFAEEEQSSDFCGFCGAGPFPGIADKLAHTDTVHHLSHDRPGCEPCGMIFSS